MTDTSNSILFIKAMSQFTDPYERKARLFPALMAILPPIVMILTLYQSKLPLLHLSFIFILGCGVLFLLSDAARRRGKMKEKDLWDKWGGIPSTQVLRFSDETFDNVSTTRYHQILSQKIMQKFPSENDENRNPQNADEIYTSAGNYLRSATRDKRKYPLIFTDNITYGFRRNGYGLKKIGITISLLCLVWIFLRIGMDIWHVRISSSDSIESMLNFGEWTTIGVSICMIFVWLFVFTEQSVREAAFSYAKNLISACESLY